MRCMRAAESGELRYSSEAVRVLYERVHACALSMQTRIL